MSDHYLSILPYQGGGKKECLHGCYLVNTSAILVGCKKVMGKAVCEPFFPHTDFFFCLRFQQHHPCVGEREKVKSCLASEERKGYQLADRGRGQVFSENMADLGHGTIFLAFQCQTVNNPNRWCWKSNMPDFYLFWLYRTCQLATDSINSATGKAFSLQPLPFCSSCRVARLLLLPCRPLTSENFTKNQHGSNFQTSI